MTDALENHLLAQQDGARRFFWHRLRNRVVYRALPVKRPLKVVDIGAGAGVFGDYLRGVDPAVRYFFVEPLASLNASLRERFGSARDASARDSYEEFDAITLLDVLEHQDDDRDFFARIAARCRPGTVVVLTVPALPILWSAWDERFGHRRRYTRQRLVSVVQNAPVVVRDTTYLFPELVVPGLLRRLKRRETSNEFPRLPGPVNDMLYHIGCGALVFRRMNPFGSSLLMVCEVTSMSSAPVRSRGRMTSTGDR